LKTLVSPSQWICSFAKKATQLGISIGAVGLAERFQSNPCVRRRGLPKYLRFKGNFKAKLLSGKRTAKQTL